MAASGGAVLGLSQADAIARQSGGAVRIESEPGHGAVVSIMLPSATG
jgi:signal transduction histidine kinase